MRVSFAFAAIAVGAALVAAAPADAFGRGHARDRLPPVSGTIHLDHRAFGGGQRFRDGRGYGRVRFAAVPHAGWSRRHGGGPELGYQGRAFAALRAARYERDDRLEQDTQQAYGNAHSFQRPYRRDWWAGDGSGLVGLISRHADDAAGGGYVTGGVYRGQTGWGTADSATTGGAYPLPNARHHTDAPLEIAYGEPDLWSGYRAGYGGVAPTGGLGYYNSGAPGGMAYYGSSSSAGPGGSPGGLGIYSSGSYGPGPRVVHVGRQRSAMRFGGRNCFCGPHIIHVGGPRHYAGW